MASRYRLSSPVLEPLGDGLWRCTCTARRRAEASPRLAGAEGSAAGAERGSCLLLPLGVFAQKQERMGWSSHSPGQCATLDRTGVGLW